MKTIFRTKLTRDFTVLPNELLRDRTLSFKARGIIAMVLSNKDEWVVHHTWLQEQGSEGREAVAGGMHELERAGYAVFAEQRGEDGKIAAGVWTFYDVPLPEDDRSSRTGKGGNPSGAKPCAGFPYDGDALDGKAAAKKEHSQKEHSQKPPNEVRLNKGGRRTAPGGASFSPAPLVSPPSVVGPTPAASGKKTAQTKAKEFVQEWKHWYQRFWKQSQLLDAKQERAVREFFDMNPEISPKELMAIALKAWRHNVFAKGDGTDYFISVNHSKVISSLVNNLTKLTVEIGWKRDDIEYRIQMEYERAEEHVRQSS